MADKILPQRVRLHIFTFVVLIFFCPSVSLFLVCKEEKKNPDCFLMPEVSLKVQRDRIVIRYFTKMRRERMSGVMRSFL